MESGIDVLVIDSLAALVPHEETEETADKKFVGLQARLIGKLMRVMLATKHNSAVICTNQLRDDIGSPYNQLQMPGGHAPRFFSSIIMRTIRDGWIEDKGKRIGFDMKVRCEKSKVGEPFRECVLPFMFRGEIDELGMLIDRGIDNNLIVQKGPYYKLEFGGYDGQNIMGRNNLLTVLNEDPELQKHLTAALGEIDG